jgi:antitoxin MazE
MQSTIIQIGNSKGIRIPKAMLKESGINKDVEIKVIRNGLKISPIKKTKLEISKALLLSQKSLARDWDRPEEDKAWANL